MNNRSIITVALLLLAFTFGIESLAAQRQPFQHWELRTAVGLLPTFLKDHTQTEIPPVSLEVRYRPNSRFSMGLLAGNSIARATITHQSTQKVTVQNDFKIVALRGAIHGSPTDRIGLYGGALLGYTHSDVNYADLLDYKNGTPSFMPIPKPRSGLFFSAFMGADYRIHSNIHVFGELGYGLSLAMAGVAVRW